MALAAYSDTATSYGCNRDEPALKWPESAKHKAKRLFPVHSLKFMMANHPWDEPLAKITVLNKSIGLPLVTPIIGEFVYLNDPDQKFSEWWVGIR